MYVTGMGRPSFEGSTGMCASQAEQGRASRPTGGDMAGGHDKRARVTLTFKRTCTRTFTHLNQYHATLLGLAECQQRAETEGSRHCNCVSKT